MQERKKNPSAFLRNIFQILQTPHLSPIIQWAPTGNGFVIKNLPQFQSSILPQYFKHKKYSSFVRQLNMYGFHKQRNSMFDNCFLHGQFRRGEELPLDIKRKPEKKKKTGENESENLEKESNWLSFSKELRHFLPQIAQNILMKDEQTAKRKQPLQQDANHSHQNVSSQPINELSQQQQQEYVSKISLRGLIDEFQENPESVMRNNEPYQNNQSMKEERQSDVNEQSHKYHRDTAKQIQNFGPQNSNKNSPQNHEHPTSRQQQLFSTTSITLLQTTMDSLSGLTEILIKQNQILRKTHPLIRKVINQSQQHKINYLKAQLQAEDTQQREREQKHNFSQGEDILEEEKHILQDLIEVLQKEVEALTESILQEEIPISNTSIRFRLERNS